MKNDKDLLVSVPIAIFVYSGYFADGFRADMSVFDHVTLTIEKDM